MKRIIISIICSAPLSLMAQWVGTNPIYFNAGNVGIGTSTPAAKLSFMNVDASTLTDGITWYNPNPLEYGLYRTSGTWVAPNYQQLRMSFATGIILNPGVSYTKSYVDIQGGGLRVSSGSVGIGTLTPYANSRLHVKAPLANPWGILAEASTNDRITGLSHDGTSGVISVSYLASGGWSPLYFQTQNLTRLAIDVNGNIGIGTTTTGTFKLAVEGKIGAREVNVTTTTPWPDYVFTRHYDLPKLAEVKTFIDKNKHLPEVPTAKDVEANGINLGEMNTLLLKKIEELTLYMIELKQENDLLKAEVEKINARLK